MALAGFVLLLPEMAEATNGKHPVTQLEDLNRNPLRVTQNNVVLESFRTLGANAAPLPFSELFSALETNTGEGQENPVDTILSSKFFEAQTSLSVTSPVYRPWIVPVSKTWWSTPSKDGQKIRNDAAVSSRDFERKDTGDEAHKALADLKPEGMQMNQLSPAESSRMRNKLTRVNASIGANVGMDLWQGTRSELARLGAQK